MLFVLVPERNSVIVARASVYIMYVTGNLNSCLFQSNKVNFFFFDNVRNMLRILHLTKYSNFS